ncbi:MAG: hypothetical protein FWG71_04855 [Synergistaceae bacterium]|nr:hypothetical protein [Synergistaceae bacterium]
MSRKLYVTTKALGAKRETIDGKVTKTGGNPILIGILTELEKEKYQFEYKTNGSRNRALMISEFTDPSKVYTDDEVNNFIYRIIPKRDNIYCKGIMKTHGIAEYDVWNLLVACGQDSFQDDAYLYEELPEGTVSSQ